jgi:outer membrane protein OmpA-like peptidoglycan-associated protein
MKHLATLLVFAFAYSQGTFANVVGADTQNFNPTNDGLDFVTVHSSETLKPGIFNLGLFLNYAVNSLPNYEDTVTQERTNFKDSLLSADFNFAVGLTENWEVGLSMPVLLSQSVDDDINATHGEFAQNGITEARVMTKVRFFGDQTHGIGTVLSANFNQIEDNPFTGTNAGPTFNFELVADTTVNRFAIGANVGYRLRNPGDAIAGIPVQPMGDQFIASLAGSYLFPDWDTKIISEIFGSVPAEDQEFISDRDSSSAELLIGMKTDVTRNLAFHFGGGTEIIHGTSSPDWRVYTGINYTFGPVWGRATENIVKVEETQNLDERVRKELEDIDAFTGEPEKEEVFVAREVLFPFNSDVLGAEAMESLKRFADYLKKPPGMKALRIDGHTDSVGSAVYNLDLSERRARSVRKALIELGVPANKIKAVGFGESHPIADNGNYQGRAANRRVEFNVSR